MPRVEIVSQPFDPQARLAAFTAGRSDAGALASFVGFCRAATEGALVTQLSIEAYPGFSEREIARLADAVASRCDCPDLLVVHRVGDIQPGEAIVLVAALSIHRGNGFEAVRVLMDYLKTDAPLWKQESGPQGSRWIEPRPEDHQRRSRLVEKGSV